MFALQFKLAGATTGDGMEVEQLSQCSGCGQWTSYRELTLRSPKRSPRRSDRPRREVWLWWAQRPSRLANPPVQRHKRLSFNELCNIAALAQTRLEASDSPVTFQAKTTSARRRYKNRGKH